MSSSRPSVLIAGCGDVGIAIGELRSKRGDSVWGLRRNVDRLPSSIQPFAADLTRLEDVDWPTSFDRVVYAAAADERSEAAYRRAYVDGVRQVAARLAGQATPPRRLVFISSTGVYGQSSGEWVDESSPTEPSSFTGRILLEGEALIRSLPLSSVIARSGGIYGPGRTALIERVRTGQGVEHEDPPQFTNRIHRDDLAAAVDHLLDLPDPDDTYLVVDDDPAPRDEVHRFVAARLGVHRFAMPDAVASDRRVGSKRCSNRRLRETGLTLHYPSYREGYGDLVG